MSGMKAVFNWPTTELQDNTKDVSLPISVKMNSVYVP